MGQSNHTSVKSQETVGLTTECPSDCKTTARKVNKACTNTGKNKSTTERADWKKNECGILNVKPAFGSQSKEDREKNLKDLEQKIKDLNADTIKKHLEDEVTELFSIGVGDVAWQVVKKGLKRFIPFYGWYTIPADAREAKEFFTLKEIYEKKLKELKKDIPEYPNKIDELRKSINKGDTATASRLLADMQADYGLINKCIRARKCLFVPYSDTVDGCTNKNKNAKDCLKGKDKKKLSPAQKKHLGCCKGQTGHHVMPDSYFTKKGKRGVTDKGICKGYNECEAPTVCVEGAGHSHGSHGKMHDATDVYAGEAADGDKTFGYIEARDATLEAHRSVFPFSFCDKDCMEEQLDAYYNCACADNKSFFGDDELNANTSVGVDEKGWHSKPLNGSNKNGTQRW